MLHFKDPQVMGVTYCACMYDQGGESLKNNMQVGFYSIAGKPRMNLIKAVTELNDSAYEHTANPASREELELSKVRLFDKWEEHSVRGRRNPF